MRSPSARCVASYAAPLACAGGAYAVRKAAAASTPAKRPLSMVIPRTSPLRPLSPARMRGPHTRRFSAPSETRATSSTILTDSAMPYGVSKRSSSSTRRSSACSVPVVMIVATQVSATSEKRQVVAPSTRGSRSAGIAT